MIYSYCASIQTRKTPVLRKDHTAEPLPLTKRISNSLSGAPTFLSLDLFPDSFVDIGRLNRISVDEVPHNRGDDDNERHEACSSGESGNVSRCVLAGPKENAIDGSRTSQGVHQGDSHTTFLRWMR